MQSEPVTSYFEILRDEIPTSFLEKLRQSARFTYEEAFGRSFHDIFQEPEAQDLCGHVRRALNETQLVKIAAECGLRCEVHSNKKRSEHHRVVRIGRLHLTSSAVRSPKQKPRFAHYRQQASLSPLFAFPTLDFLPRPLNFDTDDLYVIFVHGHDPRSPNRPAFLNIGIPSRDWKEWLELISIESLLEAQKLMRQVAAAERITDIATPKRKERKKGEGQ